MAYVPSYAQGCTVDETVIITPLETTDIVLTIENLLNEDLGNDQGICGIRIVFEHDQLANLRITLTSPSGQQIELIGPGNINGNFTDLITWNIAFTECGNIATPDMGFDATWNSNQTWQAFQTYTGTYYPSMGCLEDFDMGSANGNWVLSIENLGVSIGELVYFEIILCNDTGNDCNTCILDIGAFQDDYQIFCEDDPRLENINDALSLSAGISDDQSLYYVLTMMDSILDVSDQLGDISEVDPGIYQVCGIALEDISIPVVENSIYLSDLIDDINNRLICADITEQCVTLDIRSADNVMTIDTSFCQGDTIWVRDIPFSTTKDTVLTVFDTISNNPFNFTCDSIIRINAVEVSIEANIQTNSNEINCGQPIFLNGAGSSATVIPITQYNWSTSDGNFLTDFGPIAEIDAGGTYQLMISNGLCVDSVEVVIDQTEDFEISLESEPVFCFGDTMEILLQSTPQMDSFHLAGPQAIDTQFNMISTIQNGNYVFEAYYGNCIATDSIMLDNQATELTLSVSSTLIDCDNSMSALDYNTNASNPTIRFRGPESIPDNTQSPMVGTPGNYIIEVIDEFGCSIIDSVMVEASLELPQIIFSDYVRVCDNPATELSIEINSPVDSIVWLYPNGISTNDLSPDAMDEGTYIFTVFGSNGCNIVDSLNLNVQNIPVGFEISGDSLDCETNRVELCIDNSIAGFEFSWTFEMNEVGDADCIEVDGPGIYTLMVSDQNGCTGMEEYEVIDISENIDLDVDASDLVLDCNTEQINLELSSSSNSQNLVYQWTLEGANFSDSQNIMITEAGNYEATVFDTVSQCADQIEVVIETVDDPLEMVEVMGNSPECSGELGSILLNNLPLGSAYDVFINNQLLEMPTALQNVVAGIYDIEIISEEGCIFDSTIIIDEVDPFTINIGEDIVGVIGEQVQLNVNASISIDEVDSFVWSQPEWLSCLDCFNPILTLSQNADLSLVATDQNGCVASDVLNITIDRNFELFVPNIFTPNGDNDNDILTLFISDSIVKIFDIRITDRWGNLLFFHPEITKELNNFRWDGTSNGFEVESGVYVIMAKLLLPDNTETFIVEDITLLR